MLLVIISSLLGIAALLPLNLYFLGLVFLVPFFYFLYKENSFWKLFLGTLIFRLFFMIGTVYYTLEPLVWITTISIFSFLALAIFVLNKLFAQYPQAKIIYVPLAYLVFDILQAKHSFLPGYIITAGNSLGTSPFTGLAKYGGLLSLEFFIILSNAFLLWILLNIKFLIKNKQKFSLALAGLVIFFFSAYALANYSLRQNSKILASHENHLSVTAVSLDKNFSQLDLQKLVSNLSDIKTDLLVLPEELFVKPEDNPFSLEETATLIKNFNAEAAYIIGTFPILKQGKNYNTAILFNRQGEIISQYDKNKLTILGEYWPYAWHPSMYDFLKNDPVMKDYAIFNQANSYEPGTPKIMRIEKGNSGMLFAVLICLEGHYSSLIDNYQKNGAKFIVNPLSSRWLLIGGDHFGYLTGNLYNIESIQSGLPIIVSGVNSFAGVFFPNGVRQIVKYANMGSYSLTTQNIAY
jgi:apolipoprotein N-acyltransferase